MNRLGRERKGAATTYYSQFGEDRILNRIFAGKTDGVCVEVGANNGVDGSNTLFFEEAGWRCVLVEPIPELGVALRAHRQAQVFICAASSAPGRTTFQIATGTALAHAVSTIGDEAAADGMRRRHGVEARAVEVELRRLDDILADAGLEPPIDFISIDVEGHELEVLKGFSPDRWAPTILLVEDNSIVHDGAVPAYLARRGFVRFRRTGVNDWYARRSDRRFGGMTSRMAYYPMMIPARIHMALVRYGAWTIRQMDRYPVGARAVRGLRSLKRALEPPQTRARHAR